MRIIVNLNNRCKTAGTDAGYSFQGKAQGVGRMSGLNTQLLFQSLQNCFAATHMAGSSLADTDYIASARIKMEH